jgi:hypothetical protein
MKQPPSPSVAQVTSGSSSVAAGGGLSAWKAGILSVALLLVLALVAYGHLWRPGCVPYSNRSDLIAYHLGVKWAAYRSIQAGEGLPFWKNDQLAGGPALTNPQAMYAYPLYLLFDLTDPATAAGPTLWVQFLVMGLGMYLWGWSIGLGRAGRLFMAVAGMFNFKLVIAAYAGWMTVIPALAICPVLLAAVVYALRRPGVASTTTLGAAGAVFLISGHPQFLYYTLLLAASYVLVHALPAGRRGRWRELGRAALCLAAGAALAVGIASPLLISFVADRALVTRSGADYAFFLGPHHLQPSHLLTFLYPEWLGTPLNESYPGGELWEDVAYFGLIPLALALVGIVGGWSRRSTRWLTGAAGVCVLLAADTPAGRLLFDWFPGYAWFRLPNRLLFVVSFLGITLSGIGAEELLARWRASRARRGCEKGWLVAAVSAGVLLAMTAEGTFYARRYLTMLPRGEALPETAYAAFFAHDSAPFRIAPHGRLVINYGWAGPMGLQLITGFDPWNFRHYQAYLALMQGVPEGAPLGAWVWTDFTLLVRPDMLDALNVKYIVSSSRFSLPKDRYDLAAHFPNQPTFAIHAGLERKDIFVYRNRTCLPRAFWAERVVNAADERGMGKEAGRSDLRSTAVVLNPGPAPSVSAPDPRDRATVRAARAGGLTISTSTANRRYLVVSEIWHPGWRATVDGKPVGLFRTDIALMGMWLGPGSHEVQLTFRPVYWGLGLTAASVSAGLVATLLIIAAGKSRLRKTAVGC